MYDFLYLALLGGLGVALVAGPMGSLVVWQRMAYFGDTLAHGALLGIALGMWLTWSSTLAVIAVCLAIAGLLIVFERQRLLATDTVLGILSHGSLALGLVALTLIPGARTDMEALLFGDILTVTVAEVAVVWLMAASVLLVLWRLWPALLAITVHEDLARVEGVAVDRVKPMLKLLLALVVAISMKVVGVLLITALLIIPAATARHFAKTPEQMAVLASVIAVFSVCSGLASSWWLNTPVGPSIVVCASLFFVLVFAVYNRRV
ncbi:MAG: metal ABC transporter permease [Gammaproteobacteria bacterium]|nr:metal ABC transporter permease [Gammaproteobacteria bacterium]MBQ0840943.1 metal ABC transporter permease [Gammaproteobacteria bacterium]